MKRDEHLDRAREWWAQSKQAPITEVDIPELIRMIDLLFLLHTVRDQQEAAYESNGTSVTRQ